MSLLEGRGINKLFTIADSLYFYMLLYTCNMHIKRFYLYVWTWCVFEDYSYTLLYIHSADIEKFHPHVWIECVFGGYP